MNLPVYLYGHPVLRKISEEIDPATYPDLTRLVDDMMETMYRSEGVGLAAPQIGRNIRLVVIDASPMADVFPECEGRRLVLINPDIEIVEDPEARCTRAEACLSLPGLSENVSRTEHIILRWEDLDRTEHEEEIRGYLARIVQHECDHLEGKLYIDHISPIRKQLIRSKLHSIMSGKTRCDYPAKYAPRR